MPIVGIYSGVLGGKRRKVTMNAVRREDNGMNIWKLLGARHPRVSQKGVLATDKSGLRSDLYMSHPLPGSSLGVSGIRPC